MSFPTRPLRSRSCWIILAVAVGAALLIIPLTALIAATRRPVFPAAPGTEAIVFRSSRARPIDLYVIRPDGTDETRLTYLRARSPEWWLPTILNPYSDLVTSFRPQPTADGQGVSFISNVAGNDAFYRIDLDGSVLHPIDSPLGGNTTGDALVLNNSRHSRYASVRVFLNLREQRSGFPQSLRALGLNM